MEEEELGAVQRGSGEEPRRLRGSGRDDDRRHQCHMGTSHGHVTSGWNNVHVMVALEGVLYCKLSLLLLRAGVSYKMTMLF